MVRSARIVVICALSVFGVPAFAQDSGRQGVQLGDIDRTADPCNDFFQYANGKWREENPIPASMSRWSRRWQAGESSKDRLRTILEATALTKAPRGSIEQLTGDFYAGCMNETQIDRLGVEPLRPLLTDIRQMKSPQDVQKMIVRLNGMAISAPFAFYSSPDNHDPSFVIAQVIASGLGMPDRDYYVKPDERFIQAREKYQAYVARLFELAGSTKAEAQAATKAVVRMETELARQSLDNVALRDPQATDHKMSIAQLQRLTPRFDWNAYYTASGLTTGDVNVAEPKFMEEVDRQLGAASPDDWKAYLTFHVLDSAAPSLSKPFVEEHFGFHSAYLRGAKEMKPRWKRCVESTDEQLGEALGKIYVEKYFPPEAKARMQELVKNLRLAMKETIEELDWMSAPTKQKALEKLSTFNPKLGYPDKWKDYSTVPVKRDAFWGSTVAARAFNVKDDLTQINKPVDRGRWYMSPPTSDAYYNPPLNEIVFPAGILQPPAFSVDAIDAVNYGAIGVVIGHEISHGFDDQGSQYDAQGRLRNWWTAEDLKKFEARGACVVKQFDNYFVEPGLHHNGQLVLGESIGDLAGAKIAYRAFKISQRGKPAPASVDGFTQDQQFFIAWGQFRGDAVRPEFARTMVQGDPHPIGKYRVIGPLSNLPEFQRAFSCKASSPMVRPPQERCEVW
ncbi:endothelin-converting enzyme/putative endopeptidase [Povalibacter uvarum]|uniref:Endothelin-converting enzyme/putative endopeptidase n=1 Tax=Povalibacter uvarum TaxID=732238 RepID=A0A841HN15_9GAMM|nr:M13 family metallopeptidase [Povalibacter uvarum]MBB6093994.1 endothelin-converting enzyme/putative endopeptidase [Povalibacter uvarum]